MATEKASSTSIALLHATFRNGAIALEVRSAWLSTACNPHLVDYIFGLDADDHQSLTVTDGLRRVVSGELPGRVTAVRNWNAAAMVSTADLLFVIADDLYPPANWDRILASVIEGLDPREDSFAVKVMDSDSLDDTLMRHPIVSRAFYDRFGLFDARFDGLFCDNELTCRAFWRSAILDGRALRLDHRHPSKSLEWKESESHKRMNATEEWELAHRVFVTVVRPWQRARPPKLIEKSAKSRLRFLALCRVRLASIGFRGVLGAARFELRRLWKDRPSP